MRISNLHTLYPVETAYRIAQKSGAQVYLVGGAVRDALAGAFCDGDCDFAVQGELFHGVVEQFARSVHGKVIPWDFQQFRIAFRHEGCPSFVDFSQVKGNSITEDLACRDFTINAMAVAVASLCSGGAPDVIDPLGGRDDLQKRVIKMCAAAAFDDDPLRILRAVRFARQFDFSIDPATAARMKEKINLIDTVARERIKKELFVTLSFPGSAQTHRLLMESGIAGKLLPELASFASVTQSRPHQHGLLDHALKTAAYADELLRGDALAKDVPAGYFNASVEEGVNRRALLMFAALFHDSGKTAVRQEDGAKVSFHGHDREGARINRDMASRLGLGRAAQAIIAALTLHHMRLLQLSLLEKITDRAMVRFMRDTDGVFWEVIILAVADALATSEDTAYRESIQNIKSLAGTLIEKKLSMPDEVQAPPLLTGTEVMKLLSLPEGPDVGQLLVKLAEAETNGLINTKDEALAWLKKLRP